MTELQDEIDRLENETNHGPWGNDDPYYIDEEYADDFFDWDEWCQEDPEDELDPDDNDYEVISWDEYLASMPWWERIKTRIEASRIGLWLAGLRYRLGVRLSQRRRDRF
jgi:hypothetical protein